MIKSWLRGIAIATLILPVVVVAQPPGPGRGQGQGGGRGFGPPPHPGGQPGFGPPQHHGQRRGPGFGQDIWNLPGIKKRLGLSDDQVERLQQNRLEKETQRIELQAKTEIARLNLENQIKKNEIDQGKIDGLISELGELHKANLRIMVGQKIALGEILNASQMETIQAFLQRSRGRSSRGQAPGMRGRGQGPDDQMRRGRGGEGRGRGQGPDDKMNRGPGKEKKGRRGGRDDLGQAPGGDRPFGPPPGAGFGRRAEPGRGGPGQHGFGGPQGQRFGFGPPPAPGFPPSDFEVTEIGVLPPPEEGLVDLGAALSEAIKMEE